MTFFSGFSRFFFSNYTTTGCWFEWFRDKRETKIGATTLSAEKHSDKARISRYTIEYGLIENDRWLWSDLVKLFCPFFKFPLFEIRLEYTHFRPLKKSKRLVERLWYAAFYGRLKTLEFKFEFFWFLLIIWHKCWLIAPIYIFWVNTLLNTIEPIDNNYSIRQ